MDELVPCLCNTVDSYLPFRKQNVLKGLDNAAINSANYTYSTRVKNHAAIAKPTGAIQRLRNGEREAAHSEEQRLGC